MIDEDFWALIFAAAINNNHSAAVAHGIADDALKRKQQVWGRDAE